MHKEIFKTLDNLNINYINHTHKKVFTVAEAEAVDSSIDTQATKNLFVKDKKKNFYLITLPAKKEINLKNVAKLIGAKGNNLSFANAESLKKILNLTPGSVNPFSLMYAKQTPVKFILDAELAAGRDMGLHPMRNDMTTIITPIDLEKFLQFINNDYTILEI